MLLKYAVVFAAALPLAVAADVRIVEEIAAKVNGDIVTRGERGGVVHPFEVRQVDAAIARTIARGHRDDLDPPAGAALDQRLILGEQLDHACPNRPQPCKGDA